MDTVVTVNSVLEIQQIEHTMDKFYNLNYLICNLL
jgi:hypothetical protein